MAPEDRREALIAAAIPLLRERGRAVSTKEIAEASGVAEGTLFRAFGDKESLITAAVEAYFDPTTVRRAIARIDRALPVERKLAAVLDLLRERFTGALGLLSALGIQDGPPARSAPDEIDWIDELAGLLFAHRSELRVPPRTIARYLRLIAFSSAVPQFDGPDPFTTDELLELVLHGVLRAGAED